MESIIEELKALPAKVRALEKRLGALESNSDDWDRRMHLKIAGLAIRWRQGGKNPNDADILVDAIDRLLTALKQEELR